MRNLAMVTLLVAGLCFGQAKNWKAAGRAWWAHVEYLADDRLEGRDVGSKGFDLAAEYVISQFEKAGLAPGAAASSYSQPVAFERVQVDESRSSMELVRGGVAEPVTPGDALFGSAGDGTLLEAPLVFAGYGLDVPEAGYSDLAGLNVKGAVVVFVNGGPAALTGNVRSHASSAEQRWKSLRAGGAVGSISIPNPKAMDVPWERMSANRGMARMRLASREPGGDSKLTATWNPARAEALFSGSGHTLAELFAAANTGKAVARFPLTASIRSRVVSKRSPVASRNIVGIRPGSDPKLKDEWVILSAHLDHLGVMANGKSVNGDSIFNGAMDDASGVASLIEVAKALKTAGLKTRRSLAFVAVTGEEKGELGSRFFAEQPTLSGRMVADINMDMFLPLFPLKFLEVQGLGESTLGDDVRVVAAAHGVEVQADKEPAKNRFIRSDQYSFILQGVPALAFKFGYVPGTPEEKVYQAWFPARYHSVADDLSQPVDKEAAAHFNEILVGLLERVADADANPTWKPDSFFRRFAK